jgi:hypothetical protein
VDTGLSLTAVSVRDDIDARKGARVVISARASGDVNQIRISEQADFKDVEWQDYKPEVSVRLSEGKGLKRLYVQVRRATQVQGATIEVLSPVKELSYRLN